MARKVHEISFAIAGRMANSFKNTFSSTSIRIQQLKSSIKDLNAQYRAGKLSVDQYQAQHQRLTRQLQSSYLAQGRFNKALKQQNDLSRAAFRSVRNMLTIGTGAVAIGGGVLLGSSLKKAMDFEQQMSSIQALTGATNEEMAKMNALALEMGAKTKYNALEAAQGIEELLKAGLTPAQVQAGGLEAALNLATAGELELADAAQIMSTSLNAYKDDALAAADASNILAGTANASATDVEQLQMGLAQVSAVAAGVGMTFKDTNVALGLFANNGLKGSDSGTSLKTMLMRLIPQTKQQSEAFADLGLLTEEGTSAFFDASGELKSLEDIAGLLQKKLKKLTSEQRLATLQVLFGTDAVRAANILYEEGAAGVEKFTEEMSKVTALEAAKKKMDNAAGAVEQFQGALETLQISALLPTLPIIKDLALAAADFTDRYAPKITKSVQDAVNNAKSYIQANFLNSPEFQQLPDIQSKIRFVISKLSTEFDEWLANGGQQQINNAAQTTTGILATALDASIPTLTPVAVKLGLQVGSGILTGVTNALADSPLFPLIAGVLTPGPLPVKLGAAAVGGGIYLGNQVKKGVQAREGQIKENQQKRYQTINKILNGNENGEPVFSGGVMRAPQVTDRMFARGGFANRPSIFGEAGLEAAIPIERTQRSLSLWEQTGRKIGAFGAIGNTTIHATFAPVIHGSNTEEIKPILEEQQRSFFEKMDEWSHQKRRVAFSG